ncbi:hypothetical protein DICTH_1070 [Dictyoglomus thermophilum H-6-12]|uniref:Uncharacterized protein n=1 Tax=Dictyoglomus thermophilum (strain ATCC 35947 / DSM 3960 / H-6-12) TaxID=309799 RepID=B5YEG1_DICT6|nr:hypothetical protein DICTH_1070 [Dictyoglomus thermophilum H-6-12]
MLTMRKWKMIKRIEIKEDGRLMYYYDFELEGEVEDEQ